jgi:cobalt-zinc-cadmium efflux system protein
MAKIQYSRPNFHEDIRSLEANRKALWVAIGITAIVMVVEVIGGFLANALALLSDAGHMLADVMALLLSLIALQLALRPPSRTKTFGLYRMEILVALVNGMTLILIAMYILYEAYRRFGTPEVVESRTMLFIATVGLMANGLAAWAMRRTNKESLNIRGAYLHILGDALSSLGVIAGGLIIYFTDWYVVDPIISVGICLVILRGAFVLVKDAVNILLEAVPKDVDLEEVQRALQSIPGVKDLHHVHLWTITSGIHALSAHVLVGDIQMSRTGQILQEMNGLLREKFLIPHTTIQFECENCQEGFYCNMERECESVTHPHSHED